MSHTKYRALNPKNDPANTSSMARYMELYLKEQEARAKTERALKARTDELEVLRCFIAENDLQDHLADWALGAEHSVGERMERYRQALETIAGHSQNWLQMVQAKAALENIGADVQ